MAYIALYRKWRPGSFKELVGQEHISRTLSNAILTGKIGHAYLFSGPRGTGKTSTAKIFAKALNCEKGPTPDPCNVCENCRKINEGTSMDVFEIDAASNRGIDEIRELRETVKFAPADGRYKVYIVDEVHMLTAEAFNALLKTLEEPPAHVVFILATTEAHKVPATIQSRCQRYDFKRITTQEIMERLRYVTQDMKVPIEEEALSLMALQADGGMRDALSILDQCSALSGEQGITAERVRQILGLVGHEWIWKITQALAERKSQDILRSISELLRDGKDMKQILAELVLHMRSLMIYKAVGALEDLDLYDEQEKVLREQCGLFDQERIMGIIHRLHEAMNEMKWSPQPRITIEVALLSLCRMDADAGRTEDHPVCPASPDGDSARIAKLEARLAQLAAAAGGAVKPTDERRQSNTAALPKQAALNPAGKAAPRSMAAPTEAETTVNADGKAVWQQVMAKLKAEDKKPVLACVEKGISRGMSDTQFFIVFHSKILQQLTERNYRRVLEPILQEITGRQLQLVCELEQIKPVPKPLPKVKRQAKAEMQEDAGIQVDMDELPPEERERLQAAIDVFGNHFVELKEEKKE
jgi:DNA polymerase III subunit gamma/tau